MPRRVATEAAALHFHFVGCLPSARDHLADSSHCLGIGRNHRECAEVMQNIFRRDGFTANTGFRKRDIFRNGGVEMVTNHQHIEMLIDRIHGVRACWICRRWQHVRQPARSDDIGRMSTTRTFGVISVNSTITNRCQCIFDKTAFVERIGMNSHLRVGLFRHIQAVINRCGGRTPIFMQFQAYRTCGDLLMQRIG